MNTARFPSSKHVRLSSGRVLSFREFGPRSGRPVFHFHGIAGCGLDAALYGDAPETAKVRLICPDRPGLGESDFQSGRRILDWPNDVAELADHLGLNSFSVLGVSGGTPYALVCAHQLPHRVESCGIVSGAGPRHLISPDSVRFRAGYFAMDRLDLIFKPTVRALVALRRAYPTLRFGVPPMLAPKADAAVLRDSELNKILTRVAQEGTRQGAAGSISEGQLLARDWGFRVEDIRVKKLFLWHGNADRIVPVSMGQNIATAIANTQARFYANEGHYSLMVNYAVEILSTLVMATQS